MDFLLDFFRQEVPRADKNMPGYYRKALFISEVILAGYFLTSVVLLALTTSKWEWFPAVVFFATVACLLHLDSMSARINLIGYTAITAAWLTWYVCMFGWSAGSPNILMPILSLAFFNIFVPPWGKIVYFLGLVAFRIALFTFSLNHTAVSTLSHSANLIFQIINSVVPLLILAINCILFSSSIQASERELTIHNQELHIEAGTDPLTGLPNRRALLDVIDTFRRENPESQFSIAIADIDFFKKVNDTYGHQCGDYTLRELSTLFLNHAGETYRVCRWGGEEFCFFLPDMNLDQAGAVMHELNIAVRKLPLCFEGVDFSITVTIGVDEYDFQSSLDATLEKADRKLYMGKVSGRNQVVI